MTQVATPAEIGAFVRSVRRAQGLTQADLAAASSTGIRFLVDLEKGKPTCQVGKVLHVLSLLGVDVRLEPRSGE